MKCRPKRDHKKYDRCIMRISLKGDLSGNAIYHTLWIYLAVAIISIHKIPIDEDEKCYWTGLLRQN